MKPFHRLAAAVAIVALSAAVSARATLRDLGSLDDLKAAFNRDAGHVRLVLLVSPT
jgi:hypothetical protein